jgi:thiosulfate/3-mercaptopyruvate sulfurtransferase
MSTLIQAEQLGPRLGDPALRIFDCRYDLARPDAGRAAYDMGHLPGATYADLGRDLSAPPSSRSGRHPLPGPAAFADWLRAAGVDRSSFVVAYDDGNAMYASRLWWMLRWLGHDQVCVLDGGLGRWSQLGLPLTDRVTVYQPGDFVAHPRPGLAVEAGRVQAAASERTSRVLDARSPERFRGEVEPIDAVAGHVPGAFNHPFVTSLGPDGRFLPPEELRAAFASRLSGVPPERTIAMCGSGVTACHLLLAMEHAGFGGALLYPGSWSEWSRDPARPVARGPAG